MELLSGHGKIIIKSGISLNAGTLNQGFTVFFYLKFSPYICVCVCTHACNVRSVIYIYIYMWDQ
jgi:hypothetical protein